LLPLDQPQLQIPQIAKDSRLTGLLEEAVRRIPTWHVLSVGDARWMESVPSESVHLVLTSPPYWNLKRYRHHPSQLGHIDDYDRFLTELDRVWSECWRVLAPGAGSSV
ncbi:MAG: hypothetical protein K6T61_10445, partial [Bryobacteraceae bacterium]|nr:hypothetical protein [Bryobacteraceae bacterium]